MTKDAVVGHLAPDDRLRIFASLGLDLAGRTPNEEGWINGLRRPPALGHDHNPSFSVNIRTGAVKDFGSDYANDLFGFVQDVLRLTFPEALDWIAHQIGLPVNGSRSANRRGSAKAKQKTVSIDDALDWCKCLRTGQDAPSMALRRYLMKQRGLSDEAILNRGLGITWSKGKAWFFIPLLNDGERVTHYKATAFDVETGDWLRDRAGKKIIRSGGEVVLYMIDQALEFPDKPLVICEGEIDAVLARQYNVNAITGTGGAGTFKDDWALRIKRDLQVENGVCLLYDGDESGRSGAQKAAANLTAAGVPVRVGTLPEGKDVSDVILENGPQALHTIVGQAEPFEPAAKPSFISPASTTIVAGEIKTRFRRASEICRHAPSRPDYLVEPWLVIGTLTELIGKIKSAGKTTWVLHLVKAVLTGGLFLGKRCRQSPVVFLTEQPEVSFRHMLFDLGLSEADDLHVLYWHDVFGNAWEDVVAAAVALCQEIGARLLVIDTVFQFASVLDENDSTQADRAVGPLKLAAAQGVAVLCVRHERKGGGDVVDAGRGSSAFSGQMDLLVHLKRPEGNSKPTVRVIGGIGRFPVPDALYIELKEGQYECRGDSADIARQDAEKAILECLPQAEDQGLKRNALFEMMPHNVKSTVFDGVLKDLAKNGPVERTKLKTQGRPWVYWLPPDDTVAPQKTTIRHLRT